jgi:hypothetical protein
MSNTYSFFEPSTGLFVGQQYCGSSDFLEANTPAGMVAMEGQHDHMRRAVSLETGAVVAYQPPAPADTALQTWCWHEASESWVAEPTLAAFQAEAWARIKACRDAARAAPIQASGQWFDAGSTSRAALAQKALAAHVAWTAGQGAEWAVDWITAANESVMLGAREIINLALALDQRDQAEHALSQALRGTIAAAASKSELDAICWPVSTC